MEGKQRIIPVLMVVVTLVIVSLVLAPAYQATGGDTAEQEEPLDMDSLIVQINKSIEGKEDLPAEEVFQDIKILNGIPAKRVPMIMKLGFSRSLGVDCRHCHDVDDLAGNENPKKQVAREMWSMAKVINDRLMGIPNLESERPVVNCTTCHRGDVKPATTME